MFSTTLAVTIETPLLDGASLWSAFESLAVQMSKDLPRQALAEALGEAQERLIDSVCGSRWAPGAWACRAVRLPEVPGEQRLRP
jgi:hypothetical protein